MDKKIKMREAISFGFERTKKYFGAIFLLILLYIGIQIPGNVLGYFAGTPILSRNQLHFSEDLNQTALLYEVLTNNGYINEYGQRQDKLQNLTNIEQLDLTPGLESISNDQKQKIYDLLQWARYKLPFPQPIYYLLSFILWIINVLVGLGAIRIALILYDDRKPTISDLFSVAPLLMAYILASICYGLIILGGTLLLIIPGIIWSIKYGLYSYLIVDKDFKPIESIKQSGVLTKGAKIQLLGLGLLLGLLNFAGFLCLGIGLLWTMPTSGIAYAHAYRQLEKYADADSDEGTLKTE